MEEESTQILAKLSQLASRIISCADEAQWCKDRCSELQSKTVKLATILRRAAQAADLYARPAHRILDSTEQVLERALALITKCCSLSLMIRVFNIAPNSDLTILSNELSDAIANISWLLRVSNSTSETFDEDDGAQIHGIPPIAQDEPSIAFIWEQIATLRSGSLDARSGSAGTLASLACSSVRYAKLIIEEDGVAPLLRIIKEGPAEGRESAARAMGHLGRDPETVEHLVHAGVCAAFVKVLKEGSTGAQAAVAEAIAELVANYPKCQDLFAQHSAVRLLLRHIAVDTKRESPAVLSTRANMQAMAAKALWQLAKGNPAICKSMAEGDALLRFAEHMKRETIDDVRYYSVLAVMEIARVAEDDVVLRRSAFRPHLATAKAVIDPLLGMVYKGAQSKLLVPCVTALGYLAKSFRAAESRIIGPLVQLLDDREPDVMKAAAVALTKFASAETSLHVDYSKAIIDAGGARHLVQLVYLGEQVQMEALILLCYVALHTPLPDSEELANAGVLAVLAWASNQPRLVRDLRVDSLLPEARGRLELHQSKRSGLHC